MGRKTAELAVTAYVSNHNGEQDDLGRATWKKFMAAVQELAKREEYAGIEIHVDDWGYV